MKITKQIDGNLTTYFYDGVKKYVHYTYPGGYEYWAEYNKQGNEIHYKESNGYEWWSKDNLNNPNKRPEPELIKVKEKDVKPFIFDKN